MRIANHRLVFLVAIVISRNGSRPDIHLVTQGGIPQVGKMGYVAAISYGRFLDFHKVANATPCANHRLAPAGERRAPLDYQPVPCCR